MMIVNSKKWFYFWWNLGRKCPAFLNKVIWWVFCARQIKMKWEDISETVEGEREFDRNFRNLSDEEKEKFEQKLLEVLNDNRPGIVIRSDEDWKKFIDSMKKRIKEVRNNVSETKE